MAAQYLARYGKEYLESLVFRVVQGLGEYGTKCVGVEGKEEHGP